MPLHLSSLSRTVAPAVEPITVAEAKAQLRVLHSDDDTYIAALISAAREWAESYTRRAFISQTWVAQFDGWPEDRVLALARHPLVSVSAVKYRAPTTETLTTLSSSLYTADTISGTVVMKDTAALPALSANWGSPVQVEFVAGYGPAADAVPKNLVHAMLIMVAHFYSNRVPVTSGTIIQRIPLSVESLLKPLKLYAT